MVIVDNKIIETPIKDIVELLRQQLFFNHIDKLDKIEYTQHDIRCTCPIHSGGHEKTPSCDILLDDKVEGNNVIIPAGTVYCFGCGYRANIVKFIADCLNIKYQEASDWLISTTKYSLLENSRNLEEIDLNDLLKKDTNIKPGAPDDLQKYMYVHKYMYKRKLTDEIIDKFQVGYDPESDALTFPVYVDGILQFVAKRKVSFKRFEMPKMKNKPVYGLDYITQTSDVIVCESVINALYLWSLGYQAIALFGTGSSYQYEVLKNSSIRSFILCFDGDEAGRNGAKKFKMVLSKYKIIETIVVPNGKDANDLTPDEFKKLYNEKSFL